MEGSPIALELRRIQMLSEIGIDNKTTTIILVPSDFKNAAKSFTELVNKKKIERLAKLSAHLQWVRFSSPLTVLRRVCFS